MKLSKDQMTYLGLMNKERSLCMRNYVVNQIVAVGLTAFFSMLTRQDSAAQRTKQDLELRKTISQLHQLAFDQFTLCQSYVLGCFSDFNKCITPITNFDSRLYSSYNSNLKMLHSKVELRRKQSSKEKMFRENENKITRSVKRKRTLCTT